MANPPEFELAAEFVDAGWADIDLVDAFDVIENALAYMDDSGSL